MASIERIRTLYHYRLEADLNFRLSLKRKPFGLVTASAGGGKQALEAMKEVVFFQIIRCWHMRQVTTNSYPYL
jgi:hypothetical protein